MSEFTRRPTFFRITVGLFVLLLLFGVALAVLLVVNADRINRDGGYGWLGAALLFLVVLIIVSVAAAVTSAISLRRGEAHRGFSMVVLIASCLVALTFGTRLVGTVWSQWRQSQEAARTTHEPRVFGEGGIEIADALVDHFRRQGFSMRPALERSSSREYVVDVANLGTRCEVLSFRGLGRGKTGDKADCEAFAAKSKEIVEPLLDAFRSYRP